MSAGTLADPGGSVRLAAPRGWSVADDVRAASCEAPSARADITGRVVAAEIRVEAAHRGALVPRLTVTGRSPDLATLAQELMRDTFADDETAVLIDVQPWRLRTGLGGEIAGLRIDLAHHDMTTAMVSTTILVDGGQGPVRVTAAVPVAHHGAVKQAVEWALDSIVVTDTRGPAGAGQAAPTLDLGSWAPRGYRPAPVSIDEAAFDVFATGSHKISPRWRPPAVAAGLIEASGVATPMGHYVRRAVSRPDRRVALQVWDASKTVRATLRADILEGRAVLLSTLPMYIQEAWPELPGRPGGEIGLEVLDMASVPARLAVWLGLGMAGPERSFVLGPGYVLTAEVRAIVTPGQPAHGQAWAVDPAQERPAELWARLVTLVG